MTAVQLKALCKEQGLKVSGKKAELQERLRDHFLANPTGSPVNQDDEFDDMTDEELRASLIGRGLDSTGGRKVLLERLREDLQFVRELEVAVPANVASGYKTISEALEAAARNGGAAQEVLAAMKEKSSKVSKHIDVTVTSLGMRPTKVTAGGAPSVTADVLRSLAGDPFNDPPQYGSVSTIDVGHLLVENDTYISKIVR